MYSDDAKCKYGPRPEMDHDPVDTVLRGLKSLKVEDVCDPVALKAGARAFALR